MSNYGETCTLHIETTQIASLQASPHYANPRFVVLVNALEAETVKNQELADLADFVELAKDPTLTEAVLGIFITLASGGRWTSWDALLKSDHQPAFDKNFGYQNFEIASIWWTEARPS
jgi:hypothetical protein